MRAVGLLAMAALAVSPAPGTAQQRVTRGWPLAADGAVRISNLAGSTRVIGWERDSVVVAGTLDRDAGQLYGGGDRRALKLGVEAPAGGAAQLEIRVPARARVWIKSASADIQVEGVDGWLDLYAVSGDILVTGTPGDVYAESLAGSVEIAGGLSRTRVKTASGAILLRGAGVDVGATTVSGRITVRSAGWQRGGTGFQRGTFESVTGDILFDGGLGRGASLEFESHSGRVEIRLPPNVSADFSLRTFQGTIENGFKGAVPSQVDDLGGKVLSFSTGAGEAQVSVRTFLGPIVLRPR